MQVPTDSKKTDKKNFNKINNVEQKKYKKKWEKITKKLNRIKKVFSTSWQTLSGPGRGSFDRESVESLKKCNLKQLPRNQHKNGTA